MPINIGPIGAKAHGIIWRSERYPLRDMQGDRIRDPRYAITARVTSMDYFP